jgi:type II secretory pathway pseudopilin PulG
MKISRQKGTTTLEVIAALVLFALAAAGLAVALPMAFGRAEIWSEQQTLAWYLEKSMEEIRSYPYADEDPDEDDEILFGGPNTLLSETLNGRRLQAEYTTAMVAQTTNAAGNKVWTEIAGPAGAPEHGLLATYYDNIDFTGTSVLQVDSTIDFNWGYGSPVSGIGDDTFSVRWTGYIEAQYSGKYTFYTTSDDRVRLVINDTTVIENFTDHAATEDSGAVRLKAGKKYKITLEMAENTEIGLISLSWSSPSIAKQIVPVERLYNNLPKEVVLTIRNSVSGTSKTGEMLVFPPYLPESLEGGDEPPTGDLMGLAGLYFNEIDTKNLNRIDDDLRFTGSTLCRLENIDFDWGYDQPAPAIDDDYFGVRWTGYLKPTVTGNYTFRTRSDDGVKLWVNHNLIISEWNRHSSQYHYGASSIDLEANQYYPVTMDLYEWDGQSVAELAWSMNGGYQIIPMEQLAPTYSPTQDTYSYSLDNNSSNNNYGKLSSLLVSNRYRSYLKFNVAGISGKTVKSAKLRLRTKDTGGGDLDLQIRKTNLNWNESIRSRVLYQNQNNYLLNGTYGTYTENIPDNSFIDIPINTDFFDSGDGEYGLVLMPVTSGVNEIITFYSREIYTQNSFGDIPNNFNPDYGPRLILEVEGGSTNLNLSIQYCTYNTNTDVQLLQPRFQIVNNGTTTVALSDIKIRYWYTRDYLLPQYFACYDAAVTNSTGSYRSITSAVTGNFTALNPIRSNADYYVEIGFSSSAGLLSPGESAKLNDIQIHNSDWIQYNQTDDYSFFATSIYFENTKVTAYYDNILFFGSEPPALSLGNSMYIAGIARSGNNIIVNVKDGNGNNLSGVTVIGDLYRGEYDYKINANPITGNTDANGNAYLNIPWWSLWFGNFLFKVDNITRENYTYDHLHPNNITEFRFTWP